MFIDTSVVVAILSAEPDADEWSAAIEEAPRPVTSPLVVLEAAMRLSTKLAVDPLDARATIIAFLDAANIDTITIGAADGLAAIEAFADYGKGRVGRAQLNLADCLSYACAKNRGLKLLFKGDDFAATDIW